MTATRRRHALPARLVLFLILPMVLLLVRALAAPDAYAAAPPNIIFIVVDALRADHVSSYGYERNTTPQLDVWLAQEGVRFMDVTAASSWTNPSNGAMLTAHMPSRIDTVWSDMSRRVPESETLLAEYLHDAGYYTAGFVSNWWLRAQFGYSQGFDYYAHTDGPDRTRAAALNSLATQWLDANLATVQSGGQPLLLFLYYLDPHTWYDPPAPYDTLYDNTYTGTLTPEVFGHGHDVVSGAIVPTERDVEHLIALYDGEITYWDFQLGQMLADLQARGLLENSIIVVTSDHGQMFGEHGKWVHRNSLYEEVLRVPLLFRAPGLLPANLSIDAPVHMMDITPTLLDLVGLPVPAHMEGLSLVPLMNGAAPALSRPIYSEMAGETNPSSDAYWIAPRTDLYAVKQDGWKYVHALQEPQQDQLYLVQSASLYEQDNLIDVEQQRAQALFSVLEAQFAIPSEFVHVPLVYAP